MDSSDDARIFAESILNTVSNPLIVLDQNLRVISANPVFYRNFRAEKQQTEGVLIFELGNGQWDIPDLRKVLKEIIPENEYIENYQVEHDFPEIGPRITLLQARRINQEGGRRSLILVEILDVTEQVRARRRLEESEARYNRLVEEINSIVIEINSEGVIAFLNRFAEKIFGYRRDELIGKKLVGTILPETESDGKANSQLVAGMIKDPDRFYHNENHGIRKNGEEVWFSWSARSVKDPKTEEISFLIDGNDLSSVQNARRQAREALEILHASQNPVVRLDNQKNCRLINRAFSKLAGKRIEEIEGSPLAESGLPDNLTERLARAINTSERERKTEIIEARDAETDLEIRVDPEYDRAGNPSGFIVIFTDITRRKKAEDELRKLNESLEKRVAERTNQLRALAAMLVRTEEEERRQLAQALHDELQQLIVAAKMRVAQELNKTNDERQAGALREIEDLLRQSIDESRSITAELSPPVLYQDGLAAGLNWLKQRMLEKHRLRVDLETHGPLNEISENGMRAFLFRTIHELLFNVVKHAEVDRASVEIAVDSNQVRLVVSDLGKGYDPATVKQTDVGFGLFSIRERLTHMGGHIDIETAPGKGTRTRLEVPLRQEQPVGDLRTAVRNLSESLNVIRPEQSSPPPETGVPIRVLLADDHRIVREGFSRILSEEPGIEVIGQAEDGVAALEMANSLHPDVVVMDVTMPGMDGMEATRRLKSEFPEIKVIGLSMHRERDMAEAMRNAGAEAYLNKAGPAETLIGTIRECAAGS